MKILVVGGGAREHALLLALSRDPLVSGLVCAPGNAGTRALAPSRELDPMDPAAVAALAVAEAVDLVVVGPEGPLVAGAADAVLLAMPTQHMRSVLTGWCPGGPAVLCMKGLETGTLLLPAELLATLHPGVAACILTGPNFAHEVAAGLPAAAVVAGAGREAVMHLLATPTLRLYGNDDPVGAQLGGAAKNVIAIAAGISSAPGTVMTSWVTPAAFSSVTAPSSSAS